jgi:hypothetical protein
MKKTKLWVSAGLVALAVTLLVTCDGFTSPEPGPAELVDGKVNLTIKTSHDNGNGRALQTDSAKNAINFYEVIFSYWDPSNGGAVAYVRTSWYKGQTAKLAVPPANYDGTDPNSEPTKGQAILLAGTNNVGTAGDLTLLAVGFLTDVNTNPGTPGTSTTPYTTIAALSKNVTFTLFGLDAAPAKTVSDTSFKITNPTGYETTTANYPPSGDLPTVTLGSGGTVPYFKIPAGSTAITATYTIPILASQRVAPGGPYLGDCLLVKAGTLIPVGAYTSLDSAWLFDDTSSITPVTNLSSGVITMNLETTAPTAPQTGGFCMLLFDVQVSGLGTSVPNGLIWHLRGGMSNYTLDSIVGTDDKTDTIHGGILLGIGTVGGGVIINPPVW